MIRRSSSVTEVDGLIAHPNDFFGRRRHAHQISDIVIGECRKRWTEAIEGSPLTPKRAGGSSRQTMVVACRMREPDGGGGGGRLMEKVKRVDANERRRK